MAAYKVKMARVIAPHRYTEASGAVADADTPESELAVNERGAPKEAFRVMWANDILYSDAASRDSVSDEDKAKASELLYVPNQRFLEDHTRLGSLEKLDGDSDESSSLAASGEEKPAKAGRPKAEESK
jgi:hypothetical protein